MMDSRPEVHQAVEVRWYGGAWIPATVYQVYEKGADCIVGSRGLHYIYFTDMRVMPEWEHTSRVSAAQHYRGGNPEEGNSGANVGTGGDA